ncbi:hypothetical protein CR513_27945, partial [Mucuna pruriens]
MEGHTDKFKRSLEVLMKQNQEDRLQERRDKEGFERWIQKQVQESHMKRIDDTLERHLVQSMQEIMDLAQRIDEKNRALQNFASAIPTKRYGPRQSVWGRTVRVDREAKGAEVVLGMEWLSSLGEISTNFNDLTLMIPKEGATMVLKGDPSITRTTASFKSILKTLQDGGIELYLACIDLPKEQNREEMTVSPTE